MEDVIKFENVYKVYRLSKKNKMKHIFEVFFSKNSEKKKEILHDINFSIKKGEKVAFLGKNGSGKSTILKLISEVIYPTSGNVIVKNKVNAILELKSGFEPEFTGRENIYLKGILLGLSKKEIMELENKIIDFADIGEYIDYPIQKYSSGMKARLGFSIAVNIKPEILIIDEVLSVGDEEFKQKCIKKVNEITENKEVTLVLVTHSFEMAKAFCKRGIVIKKGKLVYDSDIDSALEYYKNAYEGEK